MHAAGHAAMALLAGALVQAMAGGASMDVGRSTWRVHVIPGGGDPASLAFLGLGAVALKVVGGVGASYVQGIFAGDVGCALRARLLDALLGGHALRQPRHEDHGDEVGATTRTVADLTVRVRDIETGLGAALGAVRAAAQLLGIVLLLIGLAPKLAALSVVVLAPFALAQQRARRHYKRELVRLAQKGDALFEAADEAVRHADLWRTYGAEGRIRAHVARLGARLGRGGARLEALGATLSGANELLGALALVLVLWVARAGGALGHEPLLPFAIAFFLAYRPVRELTEARLAVSRASAAFERVAPAWADAPIDAEGADIDAAPPLLAKRGEPARHVVADDAPSAPRWTPAPLVLDGVTLTRGVLPPIDLTLAPGEVLALVAPTGSGKSTLLRALLGLEPLGAGRITYGDVAIDAAAAGPRARPFAWVPQEAPLLADTLRENVTLGATDADVDALLAPLGAARLVAELGEQRLGAGGRALSGGERQWVAIARALATELPILLLDEPTSGLDAASQERVLEAIAHLRGRRAVIVVTHRPEPLAIADRVIDLVGRRAAGEGTVAEPVGPREHAGGGDGRDEPPPRSGDRGLTAA